MNEDIFLKIITVVFAKFTILCYKYSYNHPFDDNELRCCNRKVSIKK